MEGVKVVGAAPGAEVGSVVVEVVEVVGAAPGAEVGSVVVVVVEVVVVADAGAVGEGVGSAGVKFESSLVPLPEP